MQFRWLLFTSDCGFGGLECVLPLQGEFVKEYDLEFGPCKAGSDHCWHAKYHMPEASEEQIMDYVRLRLTCVELA